MTMSTVKNNRRQKRQTLTSARGRLLHTLIYTACAQTDMNIQRATLGCKRSKASSADLGFGGPPAKLLQEIVQVSRLVRFRHRLRATWPEKEDARRRKDPKTLLRPRHATTNHHRLSRLSKEHLALCSWYPIQLGSSPVTAWAHKAFPWLIHSNAKFFFFLGCLSY